MQLLLERRDDQPLALRGLGVVISVLLHGATLAAILFGYRQVVEPSPLVERWVTFLVPPDRPLGQDGRSEQLAYETPREPAGGDGEANQPARPEGTGPLAEGPVDTLPAQPELDPLAELMGMSVLTEIEVDSAVRRDPASATPQYPLELLEQNIEGSTFVLYIVDSTGLVDSSTIRIVRSTHPAFSRAVRAALPRMKFRPALLNGQAVRQLVQQPFSFQIRPPDSLPPG